MSELLHQLFCRHRGLRQWRRNIYGDEIIYRGWKRSEWKCLNCGWLTYRNELRLDLESEARK